MIIESGLVKAGLVKAGLVRAISNINSRYFRRNEGTTDYATIPEVTLAGDFVIEFDIFPSAGTFHILSNSTLNMRIFQSSAENKIEVTTSSGVTNFTGLFTQNVFSKAVLSRVSDSMSLTVNGSLLPIGAGGTNNGSFTVDQIYNEMGPPTSVPIMAGILANLKIWDNGTLIRDYPLDDNSDILRNRATVLGGELWNSSIGAGVGVVVSDDGFSSALQPSGHWLINDVGLYEVGETYTIKVEAGTNITSGGFKIRTGTTVHYTDISNSSIGKTFIITADSAQGIMQATASFEGVVNISIRQAAGYGTVINGNADDWGLFTEQATGEWLGQELITQQVWENPAFVESQWSFSNDQWTLAGDGSSSTLNLLTIPETPDIFRIYGEALSVTGSGTGLTAVQDNTATVLISTSGAYSFDIDISSHTRQQYKRQDGVVFATISKPSMKQLLRTA